VTRTITTARLVMQPTSRADFDDYARTMTEAAVMRFFGAQPMSRTDVWTRILAQVGHWTLFDYGYWVARSHDGRFVGNIGFGQLERGVTPDLGDTPELGYILASWAHGKGYASEAVQAAHDWLYGAKGKQRTVAIIHPDNVASIKLAQKFGYKDYARSTFKDSPTVLYERLI
jgi:RimJ/RimL family protein N-acetyltransferase